LAAKQIAVEKRRTATKLTGTSLFWMARIPDCKRFSDLFMVTPCQGLQPVLLKAT